MSLTAYTTASLIQRKQELEYCAQMCALEMVEVPEPVADEYKALSSELELREDLYRISCTREATDSAVNDWLEVIRTRTTHELLARLGLGHEVDLQAGCYRLNPRNPFFLEVDLFAAQSDEADKKVVYASFTPALSFPLSWITERLPNVTARTDIESTQELRYEALQVAGEQTGRFEFVVRGEGADALVYNIFVECF
jgi:hypothetical protein